MGAKVFVSGATGTIGREITGSLVSGGFHVTAGVHSADRSASLREAGAVAEPFSWEDEATWATALSSDVVVLTAPPGDPRGHLLLHPFIQRMRPTDTQGIIVVSARGIENSDGVSLREIEKEVERSSIPHLFLRPTWVMQNFLAFLRPGLAAAGVVTVPTGDGAVAFVDARDLGDAALRWVRAGCRPSMALTLTGPAALTYAEAAQAIGSAAGRLFRHVDVSPEQFKASMVAAGVPQERVEFMLPLWALVKEGYEAALSDDFRRFTGQEPRRFETFAREAGPLLAGGG